MAGGLDPPSAVEETVSRRPGYRVQPGHSYLPMVRSHDPRRVRQSAAIFAALEMSDLVKAGVLRPGDLPAWSAFRADPLRYLVRADDRTGRAIWDAILQRQEMQRSGGNLESRDLNVIAFVPRPLGVR